MGKKHHVPHLATRLSRVVARLETVEDEGKRSQLEERKAFLEMKIEQKSRRKNKKNCVGENLAERTQELLGADEDMWQLEGTTPENTDEDQKHPDADMVLVPALTTGMHPRRTKQKQRLMKMEDKARDNNHPKALARIALQQVYVAYYPHDTDYVPLFDCGKDILVQRAALRQRALDSAANRAFSGEVVDWIAEDMYGRLPEKWSIDDEIAMFGDGIKQKESNEEGATTMDSELHRAEAGGIGDGFVQLGPAKPPPKTTTPGDTWLQVDNKEERKCEADGE